jgi:CheY-like chemotaxis protein
MSSHKTILVLEDHEESRSLYGEILRSEDYHVIEAEHGREALEYLKSNAAPQLIVMDLTFPYMTSQEFVSELRRDPKLAQVPVLIISGQWDINEQSKALKASGFIRKPFDMDPFLETIKKLAR